MHVEHCGVWVGVGDLVRVVYVPVCQSCDGVEPNLVLVEGPRLRLDMRLNCACVVCAGSLSYRDRRPAMKEMLGGPGPDGVAAVLGDTEPWRRCSACRFIHPWDMYVQLSPLRGRSCLQPHDSLTATCSNPLAAHMQGRTFVPSVVPKGRSYVGHFIHGCPSQAKMRALTIHQLNIQQNLCTTWAQACLRGGGRLTIRPGCHWSSPTHRGR